MQGLVPGHKLLPFQIQKVSEPPSCVGGQLKGEKPGRLFGQDKKS